MRLAWPASTWRGSSSRNVGVFCLAGLRSLVCFVPMSLALFLVLEHLFQAYQAFPPLSRSSTQRTARSPRLPKQGTALHPPDESRGLSVRSMAISPTGVSSPTTIISGLIISATRRLVRSTLAMMSASVTIPTILPALSLTGTPLILFPLRSCATSCTLASGEIVYTLRVMISLAFIAHFLDNGSCHIYIRDDRRAQREIELGRNPCLKLIDHRDEMGFCIFPVIRILLARHKAITRSGIHLTLRSQRSFSYNMWHDTESCSSQEEEV